MNTMSDEELSELAECLQDACEKDPRGVSADSINCACPLGALFSTEHARPFQRSVPLPPDVYFGFVRGFQDNSPDYASDVISVDARAYALGQLFRKHYP